jgi:hypothetical protein
LEVKNNGTGARAEAVRGLLHTFSGDRRLTVAVARRTGYTEPEITAALGEESARPVAVDRSRRCEAVTATGLACVGRPLVGSLFCRRHQTKTVRGHATTEAAEIAHQGAT